MTRCIGIMGGMFDPVHSGHIAAARAACRTLELDCLHLVPCARPNHREHARAPAGDRLRMLELAIAGDDRLRVDDRELHRDGISYTVDTLRDFTRREPGATLVFVLGWDSFLTLPGWHEWESIFDYCHLCAVSRPGSALPATDTGDPAGRRLLEELRRRKVDSARELRRQRAGGIFLLEDLAEDVSSTSVREQAVQSHVTEQALPREVAEYIREHALYSEQSNKR